MSRKITRLCPACGKEKTFRVDCKTCGCGRTNPTLPISLTDFDEKVRKTLLGKTVSLVELADKLNVAPKTAKESVARLQVAGYNVRASEQEATIGKEIEPGNQLVVNSSDFFDGESYVFGVLGDTHLGSKYERLDVLNCLYDIYENANIKTVFHAGNIVDGECRLNQFDLVVPSGFEAQAEYLAKNYPQRKGIITKFITGDDHEGWWINDLGLNVGLRLQQTAEESGRADLQWIGHVEADVHFKAPKGEAWMRVTHPGGGSSYAISYKGQKRVESYQGGEKPHILLQGHYHKFNYGYPREVHTVDTGCVEDQTVFMRKNNLQAHVGGLIIRFHQADTGEINRFQPEWIPFYDKGFYEKGDKYHRW